MTLQQKLVRADDYLDMLKDKAKETDELAKENLQLRKKLDRAINELRKSDRKIERLNNDIKILLQENDNKEKVIKAQDNIINKAIEYFESYNIDFKNCRFGEAPISLRELGDLLDILKGVDKE